ncbi:hypothetical protein ACH5RR_015856 [Cinchona calisaya]|uniref:TF-B3 domain-containing protein n=1 Tax=Cinchona calisaya TaxID=153742 RepID=A0ABD2ZXY9_9GENT
MKRWAKTVDDAFFMPVFSRMLYMHNNFESVQIPTEIVDNIKEKVPDAAIIKGPFGGSWTVKVQQDENGIFLVDGWENFRVHHTLESWGCLLFTHCGNWCFRVDIFDGSGLEKRKVDKGGNNEAGPSGVKRGRRGRKNDGSLKGHLSKFPAPDSGVHYTNRTNWDELGLRGLFLDACLEEASKERSTSGNLTSESYKKVQLVLNEKTRIHFRLSQLVNQWNSLRRRYIIWSKIIAQAGNGKFDPVSNKINWNKKQWEKYIKVNPGARQFRYKSLAYPKKMKLLFGCYVETDVDGGG